MADLGQYPLVGPRLPPRIAGYFAGGGSVDAINGDLVPAIEADQPAVARVRLSGHPPAVQDGLHSRLSLTLSRAFSNPEPGDIEP